MYSFQRSNTVQKQAAASAMAASKKGQLHEVTTAASRQIFASYGYTGFTSRTVYVQNALYPRAQRFRSL